MVPHTYFRSTSICLLLLLCWFIAVKPTLAAPPKLETDIYLPVVLGNQGGAPATSLPVTPIPVTPAPVTPTPITPTPVTPTSIPPQQFLPNELVATWFNGNAPLNDFYNLTDSFYMQFASEFLCGLSGSYGPNRNHQRPRISLGLLRFFVFLWLSFIK